MLRKFEVGQVATIIEHTGSSKSPSNPISYDFFGNEVIIDKYDENSDFCGNNYVRVSYKSVRLARLAKATHKFRYKESSLVLSTDYEDSLMNI